MSRIAEAKAAMPLPELMSRLGMADRARKSARCPFHEDKRASFSVWQNGDGWAWKCHAGCGAGDEINFLELHEALSLKDATRRFLDMAGVNGSGNKNSLRASRQQEATPTPGEIESRNSSARSQKNSASDTAFDWSARVAAFTDKHLERLADWRGFSGEFCSWLKRSGLVGLLNGCIAFPIRDESGKVVATHYRLKNGDWLRYPKGFKTRPITIGELLPGDTVHIFESQWDAFSFMDVSSEHSDIIITLGAENGKLVAGLIPVRPTVYAWKQNDELKNGKRAGDDWLSDVAAHAGAKVLWSNIPDQFKDLNDWARAGASEKDLLAAMVNAEVVREAEKNWIDALNVSVVASAELRGLELIPRKKLLGDWFCEGDLGFIFAFRGVGKTWFALAIARAISTGGKLGDWEAHERVRVLYVDGEMPPDLMRDRCEGLQSSNDELQFLNHEILFERTGKVLNVANPEVQQAITARCINTRAKVLILDNLSTLASGMNENEADSWEQVSPYDWGRADASYTGDTPT
jgi:hypothetical protein